MKISAIEDGTYKVRAKITYNGETDLAVFSDVEVAPPAAETAGIGASWLITALVYRRRDCFGLIRNLVLFCPADGG